MHAARTCFGILLAAAATIATAAPARADEAAGQKLAAQWCAGCHAMPPIPVSPNRNAPRFVDVAKDPAVTETALRTFLRSPHYRMPDIKLDRPQLDDIVSYILSLKPPG